MQISWRYAPKFLNHWDEFLRIWTFWKMNFVENGVPVIFTLVPSDSVGNFWTIRPLFAVFCCGLVCKWGDHPNRPFLSKWQRCRTLICKLALQTGQWDSQGRTGWNSQIRKLCKLGWILSPDWLRMLMSAPIVNFPKGAKSGYATSPGSRLPNPKYRDDVTICQGCDDIGLRNLTWSRLPNPIYANSSHRVMQPGTGGDF